MIQKLIQRAYHAWLRKKQRLHLISINHPAYVSPTATFGTPNGVSIGQFCRIGHQCHIDGSGGVQIGKGTILAPRVVILSSSHDYKESELIPYGFNDEKKAVVIGRGCWIGWGAMIRPGITIGDGAIIAMGAIVCNDVPSGALVGGNPARIIKEAHTTEKISAALINEHYFLKEVFVNGRKREENSPDNTNRNVIR